MTNKEAFTKVIDYVFENYADILLEGFDTEFPLACDYWVKMKENKSPSNGKFTENGIKLLSWMQKNTDSEHAFFSSKEIGEALFLSGKSVAGSMRKLVSDGYVNKIGENPIRYTLSDAGKELKLDN